MKSENEGSHKTTVQWKGFLKDVLICSLGAYGGPEAHYGVFTEQMVVKNKYLSENELVELIALTGILPGVGEAEENQGDKGIIERSHRCCRRAHYGGCCDSDARERTCIG